jgi:xylan 1,4-beta-xylosidase
MKRDSSSIFRWAAVTTCIVLSASAARAAEQPSLAALADEQFAFAAQQYGGMVERIGSDKTRQPRTFENGELRLVPARDWTSGFFAGSLWLVAEQTGDAKMRAAAQDFTARLESIKTYTGTHDLGFMLGCSYGQGWRLTKDRAYRDVLIQGARSLSARYRPGAGTIRSWDWGEWRHPVIIDNMMNLELLVFASAETGDPSFAETARKHADTTLANHFRADGSSVHVVDYDPLTGAVRKRQTWQGFADDSAWARGQAWGLYGFTAMHRMTGDERYLAQARKIANFIASHPRLPRDGIPYWDFDAPDIPNAPRDASAGAVMCSALFELGWIVRGEDGARYLALAERQLRSLASPAYRAKLGENGSFLIMHCVGHKARGTEVDAPLAYGDYYFLEALARAKAGRVESLVGSKITAPVTRAPAPADASELRVTIRVDAAKSKGALRPIWRFFGADEPNYAYMKDGRKLLGQLGEMRRDDVFFRAHNLLTSGPGAPALKWGSTNAYTEDAQGRPVYDWSIVDLIFDTYRERGVRPYVEIGFMPQALSVKPEPYAHEWRPGFPYKEVYTGWTFPPNDYAKWGELAYQWAKHCVERYGAAEVERWYWETWNEANIPYWSGTPEEFHKLHDFAIAGVRRALPKARVGGPDVAGDGGDFARAFYEHCLRGTNHATGGKGTPLDFVSFHAKGSPETVDGRVVMGIANQLRTIDRGFGIVASFPELKNTPIVIGESDPEGCAACQGPQLAYRNGTMYSSYTAASFARKQDLADKHGVNFEGALTWAFTFEDQPYFAGFRQLASNGLAMPVLNVFRMFARMSGERVTATSTSEVPLDAILKDGVRGNPDVAAFASYDAAKKRLCVMVWHYHDADVPGPDASVSLELAGLPPAARVARLTHHRIDQDCSNAYATWLYMGSPVAPTREQYSQLEAASALARLTEAPATVALAAGTAGMTFTLPRQGVSLLVLDCD